MTALLTDRTVVVCDGDERNCVAVQTFVDGPYRSARLTVAEDGQAASYGLTLDELREVIEALCGARDTLEAAR